LPRDEDDGLETKWSFFRNTGLDGQSAERQPDRGSSTCSRGSVGDGELLRLGDDTASSCASFRDVGVVGSVALAARFGERVEVDDGAPSTIVRSTRAGAQLNASEGVDSSGLVQSRSLVVWKLREFVNGVVTVTALQCSMLLVSRHVTQPTGTRLADRPFTVLLARGDALSVSAASSRPSQRSFTRLTLSFAISRMPTLDTEPQGTVRER
jgi:hypothetical protein